MGMEMLGGGTGRMGRAGVGAVAGSKDRKVCVSETGIADEKDLAGRGKAESIDRKADEESSGGVGGGESASRFNRVAVKVAEAQQRVLAAADGLRLGSELVPLRESGGRRLAQPIAATSDWPPFARSGLDGYAVRAADIADATPEQPAVLRVVDTVAAGGLARAAVEQGTAVRIMTGAAVPVGADAVVMLEQTAEAMLACGSAAVLIKRAAAAGQHIAPQGEEFRLGGALAGPGTLVRPGHVALLGTFGYAEVPVRKRPRIAVFATGSELLPVEAALAAGQIRDSNSGMIAAMAEQSGAVPIMCGSLPDKLDAVREAITKAAIEADLIVTTGGVSVGDFDVMSELLRSVKHECSSDQLLFDRVAMRPGSPTSAALIDSKLLIALSGNPGACFVGFELFVRPVLLRLQGAEQALPRTVKAELLTSVEKPSPHTRYVRTKLLYDPEGRLLADPLAFSKSSMMASIADAEGLAVIPSGSRGAEAGELIDVILIP